SRLNPGATIMASPYALRPSDINPSADQLPQLGTPGTAPPAAVAPANYSPYNLPLESNPLARTGPAAGGAFQPVSQDANGGAAPPSAPVGAQEPQRLPVGDASAKSDASRLVAQARLALD